MKNITIKELESAFKKDYPNLFKMDGVRIGTHWRSTEDIGEEKRATLPEYTIDDTVITPELYELSIVTPLIYDHRTIPKSYKGFNVQIGILDDPTAIEWNFGNREFISYKESADPQKYIDFVKRCTNEIRNKLKAPDMSFEDMLDAVCLGDFEKYKAEYEQTLSEFDIRH